MGKRLVTNTRRRDAGLSVPCIVAHLHEPASFALFIPRRARIAVDERSRSEDHRRNFAGVGRRNGVPSLQHSVATTHSPREFPLDRRLFAEIVLIGLIRSSLAARCCQTTDGDVGELGVEAIQKARRRREEIMTTKSAGLAALMGLAVISCSAAASGAEPLPPEVTINSFYLQWTPEQRAVGYRNMDKLDATHVVRRGPNVHVLPVAAHQISPRWTWKGEAMDVDRYMQANRTSGVIVLKDGQIVLERYGLGRTDKDSWYAFSVTKSVTAILAGAAVQDGYIKSMDAQVTDYIPELKGSAYDGVTVRQLFTMTSGVKWSEDYVDPNSDVFRAGKCCYEPNVNPIVSYMRRLPRAAEPGTKYNYSTSETDIAGILLSNAVGKPMSEYLSEKLWQPYGMEADANWVVDRFGRDRGGTGISMTLRDYARLGQFVLDGGKASGAQVLPPGWLADATRAQVTFPTPEGSAVGYGYFWWIYKDAQGAVGSDGQAIFVYPQDKIVIAINSAWPAPNTPEMRQARDAFVQALRAAAVSQR
jgi:CubicO group peptidase (beta-lactamase class C family)